MRVWTQKKNRKQFKITFTYSLSLSLSLLKLSLPLWFSLSSSELIELLTNSVPKLSKRHLFKSHTWTSASVSRTHTQTQTFCPNKSLFSLFRQFFKIKMKEELQQLKSKKQNSVIFCCWNNVPNWMFDRLSKHHSWQIFLRILFSFQEFLEEKFFEEIMFEQTISF